MILLVLVSSMIRFPPSSLATHDDGVHGYGGKNGMISDVFNGSRDLDSVFTFGFSLLLLSVEEG